MITTIYNAKGGSGKTSLTKAIAALLTRKRGKRVLLVDTDSSSHLTKMVLRGVDLSGPHATLTAVLDPKVRLTAESVIRRVELSKTVAVDLIPSNDTLVELERRLAADTFRSPVIALKRALAPIAERYDHIFLDSPPGAGLMSASCLVAADNVIIVSEADVQGANAAEQATAQVAAVKEEHDLKLLGYVINRTRNTKSVTALLEHMKTLFPGQIIGELPDREAMRRSQFEGKFDIWLAEELREDAEAPEDSLCGELLRIWDRAMQVAHGK